MEKESKNWLPAKNFRPNFLDEHKRKGLKAKVLIVPEFFEFSHVSI